VCPGAITRYSPVTGSTIGLLTGASFVAIVSFAFALENLCPLTALLLSTDRQLVYSPKSFANSSLMLITPATYVVRGRVLISASTP
jgi:hypothetical protein